MEAGHIDRPNQSFLGHALFLTKNENRYFQLKNFHIEPKILPDLHKNVLLKSIKVSMAKRYFNMFVNLHFNRQWSQSAFYLT